MEKNLLIVDDHRMILKGIKAYLEENTDLKILLTCTSSKECLEYLENTAEKESTPQIAIIDVQFLGGKGIELTRQIAIEYPSVKRIIYSMYDTVGYMPQGRAAGAQGYISKVASKEEFVKRIETVFKGGEYLEKKAKESLSKVEKVSPLFTKKERRVFAMLLQKKTNEEIAKVFF